MKAGSTRLNDPELIRLRALMMLEYKLKNNATNAAIAEKFNVSIQTVARALSHAKRAELIVDLEDKVLNELLPAAHEAILTALKDPDANKVEQGKLGVKILEGALPGFGGKPGGKTPSGPVNELESYIEQFRSGLGVADGQILPSGLLESEPPRLIPTTAESADEASPDQRDSSEPIRTSPPETSAETMGFGVDEGTSPDSE